MIQALMSCKANGHKTLCRVQGPRNVVAEYVSSKRFGTGTENNVPGSRTDNKYNHIKKLTFVTHQTRGRVGSSVVERGIADPKVPGSIPGRPSFFATFLAPVHSLNHNAFSLFCESRQNVPPEWHPTSHRLKDLVLVTEEVHDAGRDLVAAQGAFESARASFIPGFGAQSE